MEAEQMGKVVNAVAEKVGLAVEKIQPLAEEVVRQYQMREACLAVVFGVLFLGGVFALIKYVAWAKRAIAVEEEEEKAKGKEVELGVYGVALLLGVLIFVATCLPAAILGTKAVLRAVAPLPSLLGL